MNKPTAVVLFAGGGLCDAGLRAAGFQVIGAVEYEPAIAEWYVHNHGDHVQIADVAAVDYRRYAGADLLWASPSCVRASVANQDAGEAPEDLKSADSVCRAIREIRPRWFTLENVAPYARFESFRRILDTLRTEGYAVEYSVLNAANFGVPQTRKRLILRASRVGRVPVLPQTHCEGGQSGGLFGDEHALLPWVGWYAAVEDLIPTLPESRFADWQLKRLPKWLAEMHLVYEQNASRPPTILPGDRPAATIGCFSTKHPGPKAFLVDCVHRTDAPLTTRKATEPSHTVKATDFRRPGNVAKAFLLSNARTEYSDGIRYDDEPALSTTAQHGGRLRALLVDTAGYPDETGARVPVTRAANVPANTILSNHGQRGLKALLVGGANTSAEQGLPGVGVSHDDQPTRCVNASNSQQWRALLVHGTSTLDVRDGRCPSAAVCATVHAEGGTRRTLQAACDVEPAFTLRAGENGGGYPKGWLETGRVVAMSPRALARFQSVPDSYRLPEKPSLATRIVGNGVPSLLAQRIAEAWLRSAGELP